MQCKPRRIVLWLFILAAMSARTLGAQEESDRADTLRIGIKVSPPFLYKQGGRWEGISVQLWERIALEKELPFVYEEMDLPDILRGLREGTIDLSINPLTVTSQRITEIDFTQPYYTSRSAIAVRVSEAVSWLDFIYNFFSRSFLEAVLLLFGILLLFGFLVWLFERHKNPEQFQKGWKGIASGIWWSAVTMTTVGYGDKAPVSLGGRIIAVVWMFTAIIVISGFTAAIASALTVNRLDTRYESIQDLRDTPVGTLEASASARFLLDNYIRPTYYRTLEEGLAELEAGDIEAFVYDEPILRYAILRQELEELEVLQETFNTQYYSFGLPKDSPLREELNPILLEAIEDVNWKVLLAEYGLVQ